MMENPLGRWCLVVVLGGAGCRFVPLAEVPVDGGTDEQRAIVQEVLDEIDRTLGLDVELRKIRFANVDEHRYGAYNSVTKTVRLGFEIEEEVLRFTLRHEICHAVDFQNDLSMTDEALDPVATWYRARDWMHQERTRPARKEAFALGCGEGAAMLEAVAGACDDDPEWVTDLAAQLGEDVWSRHEPVEVAWRSTVPYGLDNAIGLVDHEVVLLDDQGELHVFDPMTGEEHSSRIALDLVLGESQDWPGFEGTDGWMGGWQDGPAVATVTPPMVDTSRVLVRGRDGRWGGFGCADGVDAFLTEGRAWLARERVGEDGLPVTDFLEVDP